MSDFRDFVTKHGGRVYNFSRYNCEHLVLDGLRDVYKITLSELNVNDFVECEEQDAQVFACEDENGLKCHVGLVNKGAHLHAVGKPLHENGQVYMHNRAYFNRVFKPKYSAVRYYKYANN